MKFTRLIFILTVFVTMVSCGDNLLQQRDLPNGIQLVYSNGESTTIQFYGDDIVRCTKFDGSVNSLHSSLVVKNDAPNVSFSKKELNDVIVLSTSLSKVLVNKKDGKVAYLNSDSVLLLTEKYASEFHPLVVNGDTGVSVGQQFLISDSEGLYGLGQHQENYLNYRGKSVVLSQSNTNAVNPVLVSTAGWGLFWDNYSYTTVSEKNNTLDINSKMGDGVDYYIFTGAKIDNLISCYRRLTGKAVLLPKWAFGYWQSKERYTSQDELLSVARRYRKERIPLDCMVQDWEWWEPGKWSGMEFDSTRFPNPKAMCDELHDMNLHVIISVWPCIGLQSPMHDEMYKRGFLFEPIGWGNFRYIDVYNPEAMNLYNDYVYKNVYSQGFDGWWHDSTEPDVINSLTKESHCYETEKLENTSLGSNTRYLNTYVLAMLDKVYERWTAQDKNRRACILTRSSFAGLQRDGAITWSGDIGASWQIFRDQITAGLNFCMSGIPYWTFDIGGFLIGSYDGLFTYGAKDPAYMELYTRMFQFGAFCPVFRSHGSDAPREMWEMDEYKSVLVDFDKLRYRLMPYIYSLAGRTYTDDYTMMRALPMDFPEDTNTYDIKDEYMFGDNLLVAPVTDYMYHTPPQISKIVPKEVFKDGVTVKYYKDYDFSKLTREEKTDNIDIYWYTGRPHFVTDSMYSVHWEGKIVAPETGKYQFQIKSFDSRVIIFNGDTLKIQLDCNEPYFEFVEMEKGKEYPIICETQNHQTGAARFRLYWKTPSDFAKEQETAQKEKFREVYLPKGSKWVDFYTGEVYEGGKTVKIDAPIEKIPLLVKQGSILPMGKEIQYADENPFAPMEIRVYQGSDGEFTLYEDSGDNLNYMNSEYSKITFKYNESDKVLTILPREGSFAKMPKSRIFNIAVNPVGTSIAKTVKSVTYTGVQVNIQL